MSGLTAGWHDSDFIQDILALDHLAKYGIAPSLYVFARKVKEIVVGYVYEKLSSIKRVTINGEINAYIKRKNSKGSNRPYYRQA